MMLQALVAYADREGLGDLDFETRPVDYELRIAADGAFVGLIPLAEGKKRAVVKRLPIGPPSKNNPGYSSFLVDNAQYVLGIAKKGAKEGNAKKSFDSYVALVREASSADDPGIAALGAFLARPKEVARADAVLGDHEEKDPEKRGDRVLVPVLDGDDEPRIHARVRVIEWWTKRQDAKRMAAAEGPVARCLVTGKVAAVARTHPTLKGSPFPGTGAKLIAYDKDAFTSHHLDQGDNAPVSEPAARKYAAALNALLERDAQGRRRSALDLDDDVVVFWTRDQSDAPAFVLDVLAPPARGEDAVRAAASPWRGLPGHGFVSPPFYAVTLGVNSARVVVRDWLETTADQVKRNIDRWFEDLYLGDDTAEPIPLAPILRALQATPSASDKRGLAPELTARVFRAAVFGGPLPRALLASAVQRMRVPPHEREDASFVLRARVGIIKAVLRRQRKEVPVSLDASNTDRAYLLGRLFAAIEKLQIVAAGRGKDLNATIRDRYYGSASTTPAAAFGSLLKLSMHHASKTRDNGLGVLAERAKSEVMEKLPAERFPRTLGLDEQGLFAVGYYHQRAELFRPREPVT
jgi:CRISPR-associated protein Csd1